MKWKKLKEEPEPELEQHEDDGPLDYVIDGDRIALEQLQEEERKGMFHEIKEAFRTFINGDEEEPGDEVQNDYDQPPPDGRIIIQTDKDLKITSLNDQARRFYGSGDEVMNHSILGTIISRNEESNRVLTRLKNALLNDNERFQSVMVRGYDRGAKVVWVNFSVEALRDEDCGLIGLLWTGRDITDSVLMSYHDSSVPVDAFRSTIEAVPNPIMVIGMGRVIVAWNMHLLRMFGLDPDKDIVTAESLLSVMLLNVKDHHVFVDKVIRLSELKDGEPLMVDLKDGRKFLCHNRSSDIEGYEDCVVWSFQQLPSSGRWMEKSSERPDVHMNDIPDLLFEVDASRKILYSSPDLENILSHLTDDMVGYDLLNYVIPDDRDALRSLLAENAPETQQIEVRMLRADGSVAWMEFNLKRLPDKANLPTGHLIAGGECTDRKMSERSLIDLVHVFKSLMANTREGVWLMDEQGVILQWNQSMEMATGVLAIDAIGRTLDELDDKAHGMKDIASKTKSRIGHKEVLLVNNRFEVVLTSATLTSLTMTVEVFPITTEKGYMVMGKCAPLTGMKRTAQPTETGLSHRLVDNGPDIVFFLDERASITYCNRSFLNLLGREREETLGRNVVELLPGWPQNREAAKSCEGPFEIDVQDGKGRTHMFQVTLLDLDGNGSCQYHGSDITEFAAIRQRLRCCEDLQSKLMESHPSPMLIIDRSGRIVDSNHLAADTFAVQHQFPWTDLVVSFDREIADEMLKEMLHGGRRYGTLHLSGRDGNQYVADVDMEPVLTPTGAVSGALVFIREMKLNGSAGPWNVSKDVLGDMSKLGLEDIGQETTGPDILCVPAPAAVQTETVPDAQALPVKDKREQLSLDYARIGKGEPGWHALSDLCVAVAKEMGEEMEPNGEIDGVEIYADPLVIKVLPKLIENSLEHGGDISRADIKFFVGDQGSYVVVEDDGVGIAESMKQDIFEYSFKGRNGHDLHFIREVLAVTKLTITEDGEEGKGARFVIFVPTDRYRRAPRK